MIGKFQICRHQKKAVNPLIMFENHIDNQSADLTDVQKQAGAFEEMPPKNKKKRVKGQANSNVGCNKENSNDKNVRRQSSNVSASSAEMETTSTGSDDADFRGFPPLDNETPLFVTCGPNKAVLYLERLDKGSKGASVLFEDWWLTPNEFQKVSGRGTAKDWKRSIKHHGRSLKLLLGKGMLFLNPPVCKCDYCTGNVSEERSDGDEGKPEGEANTSYMDTSVNTPYTVQQNEAKKTENHGVSGLC